MTSSGTVPRRLAIGRCPQALWIALQLALAQAALGAEASTDPDSPRPAPTAEPSPPTSVAMLNPGAQDAEPTLSEVELPAASSNMCSGSHSHVRPTPQELEAAGARVGQIDIDVEDIFDPSNPHEDASIYRLANRLHVNTRDEAVRSQLLLQPDDVYSQQKADETERLLRGRRYIYDAWVEPTCYHDDDGTVDMSVRVRDVWSLEPGLSFSRKGGENRTSFGIQDQDFLGRGEQVALSWNKNVDRTTMRAVYEDPQLFGSWWRGRLAYSDSTDGTLKQVAVGRPFYSLDTRWSAATEWSSGDRDESRYQLGHIYDDFAVHEQHFDLSGGVSTGLRDGWTRRWLAGVRYDDSEFSPTDTLVAALPEDRKLVYPWIGLEWIQNDFDKAHNFDQIGRTEDVQYGAALRAELGLATPTWGSDRSAALVDLAAKKAYRVGDDDSLFVGASGTGRWETSDGLRDAVLQGEARYYHRQNEHALLYAAVHGTTTRNPDLDHQLLLGGDNGLRGYPLRYQSGDSSLLLTAEQRFYTDWYPFHLFKVGAAVFADAGRTWGRDFTGQEPLGWLGDAGIGLRLGNARSGLGNVLHIDLAVPLVRQPDIDSVQLLIETRGSF
jgi:hypothetical protein